MRWFFDTEFNEDGRTIELITIALVSEDGREYYAQSDEYDADACNPWVKQNVLPHVTNVPAKPRHVIAAEIRRLVSPSPEFWAYFCSYDWVALCQLYGRMVDLPLEWPMYCRDLKQLMDYHRISKDALPPQVGTEHDALADAHWVRRAHSWLKDFPK